MAAIEDELYCSNPTRSILFLFACFVACAVEQSFEKKIIVIQSNLTVLQILDHPKRLHLSGLTGKRAP
jgi:hypothetical protein